MPCDKIVVCKIKGLVVASNLNDSTQDGFILFVCGSQETLTPVSISDEDLPDVDGNGESIDDLTHHSKDSKIAKIYRDQVYYPFIEDIRNNYDVMPQHANGEIPDAYTAVSWMDGCHGQLKLTTEENVLDSEK